MTPSVAAVSLKEAVLAARQQDPLVMAQEYAAVDQFRLTIDGLQPEKGHETLYVVRELTLNRVWFAEAFCLFLSLPSRFGKARTFQE